MSKPTQPALVCMGFYKLLPNGDAYMGFLLVMNLRVTCVQLLHPSKKLHTCVAGIAVRKPSGFFYLLEGGDAWRCPPLLRLEWS